MIDHCTATIISSVSTIPFSDHVIKNGSNRSLKTCQNGVGSRGHAFTYSQMHPVVSFGVFTSYHKSKKLVSKLFSTNKPIPVFWDRKA